MGVPSASAQNYFILALWSSPVQYRHRYLYFPHLPPVYVCYVFLHIIILCYTQTRQKNLATYPDIVVSIRKARDSTAFSTITAYWSLAQNFIFVIIFIFAFIGATRSIWSSDANSSVSRRSCNWRRRWKDKRARGANKLPIICFSRALPEVKRSFIEDKVCQTRTNVWNSQRYYCIFERGCFCA